MALLNLARAAGAVALAASAGACEFLHPPTVVNGDPAQLQVHAVLGAGSDSVAVFVSRVGTGRFSTPVTDARVQVAGSAGAAVLAQSPTVRAPCVRHFVRSEEGEEPSGGCYVGLLPGGVRAGAEYTLEVDLPSGERVRGRTVVPHPPVLQTPGEGLRLTVADDNGYFTSEPIHLSWSAEEPVSLRAWAVRVWAPAADTRCAGITLNPPGGVFEDPTNETEADSSSRVLSIFSCGSGPTYEPVRPDSLEVVLAATTVDSAYRAYARNVRDGIPVRDASAGLQGAYGVFGSAASATRRVRAIPE